MVSPVGDSGVSAIFQRAVSHAALAYGRGHTRSSWKILHHGLSITNGPCIPASTSLRIFGRLWAVDEPAEMSQRLS